MALPFQPAPSRGVGGTPVIGSAVLVTGVLNIVKTVKLVMVVLRDDTHCGLHTHPAGSLLPRMLHPTPQRANLLPQRGNFAPQRAHLLPQSAILLLQRSLGFQLLVMGIAGSMFLALLVSPRGIDPCLDHKTDGNCDKQHVDETSPCSL